MSAKLWAVVFDWGDTLMRDLPQFGGPMVDWPQAELVPGVAEALAAIGARYVCCVASNAADSDAELMGRALERVHIRGYFHYLWTSRELGAAKPSPKFFAAILERLSLDAAACAYVGNDYGQDITPARAAGFKTVWYSPAAEIELAPDYAIVGRMDELPSALLHMEAA